MQTDEMNERPPGFTEEDEKLDFVFNHVVKIAVTDFLEGHPEVIEARDIELVMKVYGEVFGRLAGLETTVHQVAPINTVQKERYLENCRAMDSDITDLINGGEAYLTNKYPVLNGLTTENGPLIADIVEGIVANTLFHLFGIQRIPIPGLGHAFTIKESPDWQIAGLDPEGFVGNVSREDWANLLQTTPEPVSGT